MTKKNCVIKVIAMPADLNPDGDVFGGWIVSQMDLAGSLSARKIAKNRVVTVTMKDILFIQPVYLGDRLECYTNIVKEGNTSITVDVEVIADRREGRKKDLVATGRFVFVSIDENRKPKPIK